MMATLDASLWRGLLAAAVFLAAVHAYRKLTPYFALTWFGSGLLFGYLWPGVERQRPEVVLLPVLVFYLAAAVAKGLVENRRGLKGNHLLHVALAGLLTGPLALPWLAVARARGFGQPPRPAGQVLGLPATWLGGVPSATFFTWMIAGAAFYGVYKLVDHLGGRRPVPTVLLFVAQPLLVKVVARLSAALV